MILCIGAEGGGKTLLLRKLQSDHKASLNSAVQATNTSSSNNSSSAVVNSTVPTTGVNITTLLKLNPDKNKPNLELIIRELGGSMSELWSSYYKGVRRLLYVIDAANMSQLASTTLLLMPLLAHPNTQKMQIALVFNKMDRPLPRDTSELLAVLRYDDLQQYCRQKLLLFEVSAVSGKGLKALARWMWGEPRPKPESLLQ
uniref:ADP-ribosylation factor-like protein 16 n=1 Tax=Hirondellea gigas TaxID=1518452 RepID=A0A2P2I7V1_9CRUS